VKLEEADKEEDHGHAFRVMDAYVNWLEGRPLTPALSPDGGEGVGNAGAGKRSWWSRVTGAGSLSPTGG